MGGKNFGTSSLTSIDSVEIIDPPEDCVENESLLEGFRTVNKA